jgi:riboflavin biosynthesis pyrimidine reductase
VPVIIATSPDGFAYLRAQVPRPLRRFDPLQGSLTELHQKGMVPVLVSGKDGLTDAREMLRMLKRAGVHRLLVESPSFGHGLISERQLDEMFLNISCVYLGGGALSLGSHGDSFTSAEHPHTEVLSIHTHSPHFFYVRHKMIYGVR